MFGQPFKAVLLFICVYRFGDAVAVEDQPRTLGESYAGFGIISASYAERQSALGVEELRSLFIDKERMQMSGIGEDHGASCRIEHGVNQGDELARRKVFYQQSIELGQNLAGSAAGFG